MQILSTDESLPPMKRIIKKAEKKGIYQALNIASIWLDQCVPGVKTCKRRHDSP